MASYIKPCQVFIGIDIPTRVETLDYLATQSVALGLSQDKGAVLDAFISREKEGPTGLTDGFAIPHAKCKDINNIAIVVVKLTQPIEWPDFDDKKVDMVIALFSPSTESSESDLNILNQIASMLMDDALKVDLRATNDPAKIARMISTRINA